MSKKPLGITGKTGSTCPESGTWKSLDEKPTKAVIFIGTTFPPHRGKVVTWELECYGATSGVTFVKLNND